MAAEEVEKKWSFIFFSDLLLLKGVWRDFGGPRQKGPGGPRIDPNWTPPPQDIMRHDRHSSQTYKIAKLLAES